MSAGQFIVCNSSDCKICLVKIFFFFIKQCFSQGSLKMDSKYLCSTRRNSSQLLRSNSRGALARAPGEAAFCPGERCAGTGHCCSCSAEALRSRALYSECSVAKKGGHEALLDLPILAGKTGFSPSATQAFHWCSCPWKGQSKLGSWAFPHPELVGRAVSALEVDPGLPSAFFFLSLSFI